MQILQEGFELKAPSPYFDLSREAQPWLLDLTTKNTTVSIISRLPPVVTCVCNACSKKVESDGYIRRDSCKLKQKTDPEKNSSGRLECL